MSALPIQCAGIPATVPTDFTARKLLDFAITAAPQNVPMALTARCDAATVIVDDHLCAIVIGTYAQTSRTHRTETARAAHLTTGANTALYVSAGFVTQRAARLHRFHRGDFPRRYSGIPSPLTRYESEA